MSTACACLHNQNIVQGACDITAPQGASRSMDGFSVTTCHNRGDRKRNGQTVSRNSFGWPCGWLWAILARNPSAATCWSRGRSGEDRGCWGFQSKRRGLQNTQNAMTTPTEDSRLETDIRCCLMVLLFPRISSKSGHHVWALNCTCWSEKDAAMLPCHAWLDPFLSFLSQLCDGHCNLPSWATFGRFGHSACRPPYSERRHWPSADRVGVTRCVSKANERTEKSTPKRHRTTDSHLQTSLYHIIWSGFLPVSATHTQATLWCLPIFLFAALCF